MDQQQTTQKKRHIDQHVSTSPVTANASTKMTRQHNIIYQVIYTVLVSLGAYEKQQQDKNFNFTITLEDAKGGKFDDLVLRCPSLNGALYMQCKHQKLQKSTSEETTNTPSDQVKKQKAIPTIVESALLDGWKSTQPYSISKHFVSFLKGNHSITETNLYLLCTNAMIGDDAIHYFTEEEESGIYIFSGHKKMYGTFYKINKGEQSHDLTEHIKKEIIKKEKGIIKAEMEEKIAQFYDKFRIVCTPDTEELQAYTKQLLSKVSDANVQASFDKLFTSIFNVFDNNERLQIHADYLNNTFRTVKRNTSYTQLKEFSEKYIKSIIQTFTNNLIKEEWLKNSHFYQVLSTRPVNEIYRYRSFLDLNVSSMIIFQTLALLESECLFIQSSKYESILFKKVKHVCEYLDDQYLRQYVIVVFDELESSAVVSLTNLPTSCHLRLIILSKDRLGEQTEKSLLVRDLTEEARNKLFEENKELQFFGTNIPLENLVQQTDDLTFLFYVLELHTKATKRNSLNFDNYEKIKNIYIQRDFEDYRTIASPEDLTNREVKKLYELLKDSFFHNSCSFEEITQILEKSSILSLVQSSLTEIEKNNNTNLFTKNSKEKYFIFLDEAGFGKSTYFTWLAWRLSDLEPSLLIIKLNAVEYSSEFDRLKMNDLKIDDDSEMVRILYRFVSLALGEFNANREFCENMLYIQNGIVCLDETKTHALTLEQLLELRLFCYKFNEQQLILLLDGFDEIAPNYLDVVIKCFTCFGRFSGIRNIYLSSRPYDFQDVLKTAFRKCTTLQLKPYSQRHQILSLHKYFSREVQEYSCCVENDQAVVLSVVYAILYDRLGDLTKTPLLLHLAIELFLPILRQHIYFTSKTISGKCFSSEQFQTFQILQTFIKRKTEILITEKSGSSDTSTKAVVEVQKNKLLTKQFEREHNKMAIYIIFDKSYTSKILSNQNLKGIMEKITNAEEKAGIIVGFKNNIPLFIHRYFAEYFAALWLFTNKDKLKTDNYFKSQLFWIRGLDRTRDFFNQMIAKDHQIHLAVLNKSFEHVNAIVSENTSSVALRDVAGRIPLHLALQHDNHQIMRHLLQKMSIDSINSKDDIFGWSALDYAFVTLNKFAIKTLLEFEANINLDALIDQLRANDDDNMLIRTRQYINYLTSDEDIEQLAVSTVNCLCKERRVDIHAPREQLNNLSMVEYCIDKNMYVMFKQFIVHLDNPMEYLGQDAKKLFQTALGKKAYNVLFLLVDEYAMDPPDINDNRTLFTVVISAIALNRMKSFQKFLDKLCSQLKIDYRKDTTNFVEDYFDTYDTASLNDQHDQYPKSCCVRKSNNVLLPLPEYDERNVFVKDHLPETLLARAAHEGNIQMMSHIIQKFQMTITNKTIVTVMRLLPKGKRTVHSQSLLAFKYLLNKTTDRESIDEQGRNLLHMTIHNGCFFMVLCLIDNQFNHILINERNRWNVFHYIASSESKFTNRAFKLYQKFKSLENRPITLDRADDEMKDIYEIAILHNNFDIARDVIESTLNDPIDLISRGFSFVLDTVNRLVELEKFEIVLEYFKYLFEYGEVMWMELYGTIRLRVPVI